jgi:Skp family chaperone for outer membrane proteins
VRRGFAAGLAVATLLLSGGSISAQEIPRATNGSILLTLEPDRLITDTQYGKAMQARIEAAAALLLAENRKIDADLEAEEVALTSQRATLPAADFRALAEAFDAKVEAIRTEQESKLRDLSQQREAERQKVLQASIPILAELMAEKGAVAILDKASVFLAFDSTDVTDEAIAKLDAELVISPSAPLLGTPASPDVSSP